MRADARYAEPLARTARFLDALAARTGARFVDFSDPAGVPCAEDEFFDADHPAPACLARIAQRIGLPRAAAR
jgi:hypothetical protein